MDWIANSEIGLDPNNSVIKRLCCIFILSDIKTFETFPTPHSKILFDQHVLGGWHSDVDTVGRAARLHEYFLGLWVVSGYGVRDH